MEQRILGATGRRVTSLGLGAMPLAITGRPDESDAVRVVHRALELGVSWIDVADSYCLDDGDIGYGERLVARAVATWPGGRDEVMLTTKGGYVRPRGEWELDGRPSHLRAACDASLKALGVSSIFLYQLHGPDPRVYWPDSVGALADLRAAGKIQHVGVCNVDVGHLKDAAKVVPVAELKAETRKFAERLAQNPPAAIAGTKSLVYQAAVTPTRQQLDAEETKIIDAMHTDDFRVAVKKFTSKKT